MEMNLSVEFKVLWGRLALGSSPGLDSALYAFGCPPVISCVFGRYLMLVATLSLPFGASLAAPTRASGVPGMCRVQASLRGPTLHLLCSYFLPKKGVLAFLHTCCNLCPLSALLQGGLLGSPHPTAWLVPPFCF